MTWIFGTIFDGCPGDLRLIYCLVQVVVIGLLALSSSIINATAFFYCFLQLGNYMFLYAHLSRLKFGRYWYVSGFESVASSWFSSFQRLFHCILLGWWCPFFLRIQFSYFGQSLKSFCLTSPNRLISWEVRWHRLRCGQGQCQPMKCYDMWWTR